MQTTISKFQNEPIYYVKFPPQITIAEFTAWIDAQAEIIRQTNEPVLVLMDVTESNTTFEAVLHVIKSTHNHPDFNRGNVVTCFYGTNTMAKLTQELAKLPQFGSVPIPIFRTVDDALDYLRLENSKR